jgi:hypothetical protein
MRGEPGDVGSAKRRVEELVDRALAADLFGDPPRRVTKPRLAENVLHRASEAVERGDDTRPRDGDACSVGRLVGEQGCDDLGNAGRKRA